MSSGSAISTRQTKRRAFLRHVQRDEDAERDLYGQDDGGEDQVARQGLVEAGGTQHLLEPGRARPEELVVSERVLHRIVDDGHQRDDGREGDQHQYRQHQEPGFVVPGLVHDHASLADAPGMTGIDVDGRDRRRRRRRRHGNSSSGTTAAISRLPEGETRDLVPADILDLG
jgi:hypothetical protein